VLTLRFTVPLALTIFAWFAGYFAMIGGSSFALVAQLHFSTLAFAIAFALEAAAALLGSFVASHLAWRFTSAHLLAASLALALAAGLANGVTGIGFASAPAFIVTMSVYAFAFGVGLPSAYSLVLADAGSDAGVASGILGAALALGGALGSAITGALPFAPTVAIGSVVAAAACTAAVALGSVRRKLSFRYRAT
jgi:predicted MFS family arabinose efflux permease